MRNLLASTAIALVAMAGAASAQSVLERVLGSIEDIPNASTVNGTFANIAENIGVLSAENVTIYEVVGAAPGTTITQDQYDELLEQLTTARLNSITSSFNATTGAQQFSYTPIGAGAATVYSSLAEAQDAARRDALADHTADYVFDSIVAGEIALLNAINGSITNTMEGIAAATASNGDVFAINEVTVDIGDLTTTVLGAVNTGDIALGANMGVSEAVAGASQAIHGTIDQIGGSVDTAALVLNIASNSTSVLGNVNNQFASLNGSIGNVTTTVLGSVNTGTITNGLNASINGTISDIVGASVD
jgi:hypothetical protein